MNTNQIIPLEERFYVGEHGFKFVVRTGLDMSALAEGEIMSVLKRPKGSVVKRVIPLLDIQSATLGTVLMSVGEGDFSEVGQYQAQIFIRDVTMNSARPSHVFTFIVQEPVVSEFESIFA